MSYLDSYSDFRQYFEWTLAGDEDVSDNKKKMAINAVRYAIEHKLTPIQRQYLLMYFVDGHTTTDIANICYVDKSTVSRVLKNARQRIFDVACYTMGVFNNSEQLPCLKKRSAKKRPLPYKGGNIL